MPHRKLRDICAGQTLVHAAPSATVSETAKRMKEHGVGTALILQDGKLAGLFSWGNLRKRVLANDLDPKSTPVGNVMTTDLVCLDCDEQGIQSIRAMNDRHICHVIVNGVGEQGYGIVSVHDFPDQEMHEFEDEFELEEHLWEEI